MLVAAAIEEARRAGARSVELRHTTRQCPGWHAKEHKVAMRLPLRVTADEQWTVLDRKVRNQVRKAEKSGLTSRQGGPELLDAFYDIFARNMRDLGTPVYSRRFFEEVLRAFPEASRVFTVWKDDQPAAASIVYRWRGTMEVPWASSLREFNPLCANIALYWDMLRDAIAQGCTVFDFGRSTPNEGTYNFKKQWGAEPVPLVWEYWVAEGGAVPDLSPKNAKYRAAISLWQKLPVGLTRVIGPPIVRNIP
jgi:FemAB-related protein (PEP-CTERM system-associated)